MPNPNITNIKARLNWLLSQPDFILYHKPSGRNAVFADYWEFEVKKPTTQTLEGKKCRVERMSSPVEGQISLAMKLTVDGETFVYRRRSFTRMIAKISSLSATRDPHAGVQ